MNRKPIIESLLDTDFYKLTMGQLVFRKYRDVKVKYEFINRTDVRLGNFIPEPALRAELDHVKTLGITRSEYRFLRGIALHNESPLKNDYIQFLQTLRMTDYDLCYKDGNIHLSFSGPWSKTIYWETLALSIINQLYYRALRDPLSKFSNESISAHGTLKLADKVMFLKANPNIRFSDFGTRRRHSAFWHDYVVRSLHESLPEEQFVGTSNVMLAMRYDMDPIGTHAHELFMAMAAMADGRNAIMSNPEDIKQSHNEVLREWYEMYGYQFSIALTDTYGSDFFFRDMTAKQARDWKGLRQDSGDPSAFADKAINFYKKHDIDPLEKIIVFSDGLDMDTMKALHDSFSSRIGVRFGWGTNLTNDLGIAPLSIVVKLTEANGKRTVKLSDNLAKATGSPEDIQRYKAIFGYTGKFKEATLY